MVHLTLPGRISFQFDTAQFIEIACVFDQSVQILKAKATLKQKSAQIIKLNHLH
jgi:hypothetical protein